MSTPTEKAPPCLSCGKKLRRYKYRDDYPDRLGADGRRALWGDYGDNIVCGQNCGYQLSLGLTKLKLKQGDNIDDWRERMNAAVAAKAGKGTTS